MSDPFHGWMDHPADEGDIRKIVLGYALLAPSPHNIQPCVVEFVGPGRIHLYIDTARLLPACDPDYRMIYISHGAFIENLDIAARNFGYKTDIYLFPGGWPGRDLVVDTPVAAIDLIEDPDSIKDPLFNSIPERESNKRPFKRAHLSMEQITALSDAYDSSYIPISLASDPDMCRMIAGYIVQAFEIDIYGKERLAEILHNFRFSKQELEKHRDGSGIAQSGITGIGRILYKCLFPSREKAASRGNGFATDAVKRTRKQAFSASCFGWISTKGNTRLDQVKAGRSYERVCLKVSELGLAIQPFSQILAQYPEMKDLNDDFREFLGISETHTLQMLFRIGFAHPVPHSPRRPLGDFIRQKT
ncbi:MAG TPA: hypothetical protein VMW63_09835 [Methanoregulaceae archaeon]|nr:hypothetical protein [Methanoregulaceae archaeon]